VWVCTLLFVVIKLRISWLLSYSEARPSSCTVYKHGQAEFTESLCSTTAIFWCTVDMHDVSGAGLTTIFRRLVVMALTLHLLVTKAVIKPDGECQQHDKKSPEVGSRDNYRNVAHIKYTSDNRRCLKWCFYNEKNFITNIQRIIRWNNHKPWGQKVLKQGGLCLLPRNLAGNKRKTSPNVRSWVLAFLLLFSVRKPTNSSQIFRNILHPFTANIGTLPWRRQCPWPYVLLQLISYTHKPCIWKTKVFQN
jgi:hypothetical protein